MESIEKLSKLNQLLENVSKNIMNETQYSDISPEMDEIQEICSEYSELVPLCNHLMNEIYRCKGDMSEVIKEINDLTDECFQLRLFKLLTDN